MFTAKNPVTKSGIKIPQAGNQTVHEAVGVFKNTRHLQAAIDDLQSHGFMWHELSVLANPEKVRAKMGRKYTHVRELEDSASAPRTVFLPNETAGEVQGILIALPLYLAVIVTAGLMLANDATLAQTVWAIIPAGAVGGALGFLLAQYYSRRRRNALVAQIKRGGIPLWVNLRTTEQEDDAMAILRKHNARDVHVHDVALYG